MKSFGLSLTLIAAAAATGCDRRQPASEWSASGPTRLCVDATGRRLPDADCERTYAHGGGYAFYYLGRGGLIPPEGGLVRGGGYTAAPGVAYGRAAAFTEFSPSAGVARGGFGGSAHGGASS